MDTSKFSLEVRKDRKILKEALELITPHLEHLSFVRFRDCHNKLEEHVEGHKYTFQYWIGNTVYVPASWDGENVMVYPFRLSRREVGRHPRIREIHFRRLLLKKSWEGGLHGSWFLEESRFRPAYPDAVATAWECEESPVRFTDDDRFGASYWTDEAIKHFAFSIHEWFITSCGVRQKALNSLKEGLEKFPMFPQTPEEVSKYAVPGKCADSGFWTSK